MKGFTKNGKFHPITDYKGVRKSRDQSAKSTGVKIRKARCTTCQEYKSILEMGSPSNVCLDCMKKDIPTGFCPVCNRNISRGSENEVKQHIKEHIKMKEHAGHQGVCDCGIRKDRDSEVEKDRQREREREIEEQIKGMKKLLASGKCDSPMRTQRHLARLEESIGR